MGSYSILPAISSKGGPSGPGGNQFFPFLPSLPNQSPTTSNTPGIVPPQGGGSFSAPGGWKGAGGGPILGGGDFSVQQPIDPNLTGNLFGYLNSQIGKGVTPFDLSAILPSSGDTTQAGTLTAPNNALIQMLQQFFQTGKGGGPGGDFLSQLAQGGAPGAGNQTLQNIAQNGINAVPTWQTMVDAMQRQIQEGSTNLKEAFNVGGGLVGSPYGTALTDYTTQSNKDLNSILAQLEFQGINTQVGAAQTLGGEQQGAAQFLQGQNQDFAKYLQGLDQSSIDRLLNEFIRTSPQYNPLLGYEFGAATTFNPVLNKSGQTGGGFLGGLSGAIGPLLAALGPALAGGGAAGAGGAAGSDAALALLAA